MIRFSFVNLAATATLAASTTFTEAEAAVGLRHPERPFRRGYAADLTAHRITLNFGSAKALGVVALIHANFTAAVIQGHASDVWTAPSYSQAITLGRTGGTRRYHHAHRPTAAVPFNYQYLSLSVTAGSSTDGASQWALGGIWAGMIVSPPRDIRPTPMERTLYARQDLKTADGRPLQRLTLDEPRWTFSAKRQAIDDTELEAWREIDRQWAAADFALVLWQDGELANVYVMRRDGDGEEWPHARIASETTLDALEVTAG